MFKNVFTNILKFEETLRKVIPAGGHAFLYGSQARNEARPDSDWGILILLDKPKIEVEDHYGFAPWIRCYIFRTQELYPLVFYAVYKGREMVSHPIFQGVKHRADALV